MHKLEISVCKKVALFFTNSSLLDACEQFLATFAFCQLPAGANQIAYDNCSVFLFLGKTLLAKDCELSTTF